jgi:hypothetical protein
MKDTQEFVNYLKKQGYKPFEIQYACSLREYGETMTKAIYDFDLKCNTQEIDGFPDSSIKVLEQHYGKKRLKIMKFKTLYDKVYRLQRCLVEIPDKEHITEAINYYLG